MKYSILTLLLVLAPGLAQAETSARTHTGTGQILAVTSQSEPDRISYEKKQIRLHVTEAGPCASPTKMLRHECMKGDEARNLATPDRAEGNPRQALNRSEPALKKPVKPVKPGVAPYGVKPVKPVKPGAALDGAKPVKPILEGWVKPFPTKPVKKG